VPDRKRGKAGSRTPRAVEPVRDVHCSLPSTSSARRAASAIGNRSG
jgi:hypothetical protein